MAENCLEEIIPKAYTTILNKDSSTGSFYDIKSNICLFVINLRPKFRNNFPTDTLHLKEN